MKKITFLFIIGLLLLAYITNAQKPRYIKTNTYEGVVFLKHGVPSYLSKHLYVPTNKEIATMEKKIADSIGVLFSNFVKKSNYKGECDFGQNLQKFKRQYYGYRTKKDIVIYVTFYLQVPDDWKEVWIVEGLSRRCEEFKINYSITSGKFLDFFTSLSPI